MDGGWQGAFGLFVPPFMSQFAFAWIASPPQRARTALESDVLVPSRIKLRCRRDCKKSMCGWQHMWKTDNEERCVSANERIVEVVVEGGFVVDATRCSPPSIDDLLSS
jgi:hypothetical protein